MVVQRKTPGAPGAPAASRSSSNQALPKASNNPVSPPRATPPTLDDINSKNKHHKKSKLHEVTKASSQSALVKRKTRKPLLPTRFFLLLLTIFSIYSLATCPNDHHRVSPICRSLDVYKNSIVEPYLVPPIRHLSHLAKPHLEPLKPYTDPVVEFTQTHVIPRARFVKERVIQDRVIPFYKEYVYRRIYKGYLRPTWRLHVQPRLEPYLAPIKAQYQKHVLPIWHTTQKHALATYEKAQPHIDAAVYHAQATYIYIRYHSKQTWRAVKPRLIQAYAYSKPRAIKAWKQVKPYLCKAVAEVKAKAGDASRFLGQQRRTYVDPHVRRIWEKVVEPSNGADGKVGDVQAEETPAAVPTTQSDYEADKIVKTTPVAEPVPVQTAEAEQETVAANVHEPEEPSTPAPEPTPVAESIVEPVVPEPSEAAAHVPITEEAAASAVSVVIESLHPESTPIAGVSAEAVDGVAEDVDGFLDDFLKELGYDKDDDLSTPPSHPEAEEAVFTPVEELLEAESASSSKLPPPEATAQKPIINQEISEEEKKRLTAQKREEIVGRHVQWEKELREFVEAMEREAREALSAAREEGVRGLLTWSAEEERNGQGKGVLKEIEEETSRFMKGLEGYVRGSEKRLNHLVTSGGSAESVRKAVKSEKIKFDNVLSKTHTKFSERLQNMQMKVGQFVQDVRGKEKEAIDTRSQEVMRRAEEAQGDLALDYAWLDDVSYYDWQRYHDLVRVAENFTALCNALHSNDLDSLSTYHFSTPLPDPLVDKLMELEREVQEVVDGFEVWVEGITRRGKDAMQEFADRLPAETTAEAPLTTQDKQKTVRFGHAVPSAKERLSILPVEPSAPAATQTNAPELDEQVQHIFMGRSKEEVEQRVKGVQVEQDIRKGKGVEVDREEL